MSLAIPYSFHYGTHHQRLLLSVGLAIVFHLVLVFGVGFETETKSVKASLPTLEILLSKIQRPSEEVEDPAFLSQNNQQGEREVKKQEAEPLPVPEALVEAKPEQVELATVPMSIPVPSMPKPPPAMAVTVKPLEAPKPKKPAAPVKVVKTKSPVVVAAKAPSAAALMSRSLAMAQLSAEVESGVNSYARLPRQTHISARTKEFKYATYMEAWSEKVERIGNLNYPEQARKDNLTGSLILDVCLRPDGSIESIDFIKSSGHEVLDQGAERIVRMAAPFAVFPENIREDTDLLHITRTWQFVRGNRLSGF